MISLPEKLIFPVPFAGGEGAALTKIEELPGADNKVNFKDGFPSVYGAPQSGGGKYVTRGQLNAIGNLATKNEFYRMCGGINTFDSSFAEKIGGYPRGAILDYCDGVNFFKVISKISNNMVNFNTDGFENGAWGRLNTPEVLSSINITSIKNFLLAVSYSTTSIVTSFTAPRDCELVVQTSVKSKNDVLTEMSGNSYVFAGTGLMWAKFENNSDTSIPSNPAGSSNPYGDPSSSSVYGKYWLLPGLPTGYKVGVSYRQTTSTSLNNDKYSPYSGSPNIKKGDFIVIVAQNGLVNGVASLGTNSSEYIVDIDVSIK